MVVPQRGDGTVHGRIIHTLGEMGDWMEINREGIHGTRPWRVFGEGPSILKPGVEGDLRAGKLGHSRNRSFRATFGDFAGYTQEHLRYTQCKDGKTIYAGPLLAYATIFSKSTTSIVVSARKHQQLKSLVRLTCLNLGVEIQLFTRVVTAKANDCVLL